MECQTCGRGAGSVPEHEGGWAGNLWQVLAWTNGSFAWCFGGRAAVAHPDDSTYNHFREHMRADRLRDSFRADYLREPTRTYRLRESSRADRLREPTRADPQTPERYTKY